MDRQRSVLFTVVEVRATLDGRKTQFRRPMKPAPTPHEGHTGTMWDMGDGGGQFAEHIFGLCAVKMLTCPYGKPGDLLYVQEPWSESWAHEASLSLTGSCNHEGPCAIFASDHPEIEHLKWRTNLPRHFARIWLRVTDVRVERVQEIDEAGALAEGCEAHYGLVGGPMDPQELDGHSARYEFSDVWDELYGTWDDNPWVWVVAFERTEKP